MKFSVVVVSYNRTALLRSCLDSVFRQGYPELEVIVVDNQSEPETVEYLRSVAGIRLIENMVNGGFAQANNLGASQARGDWVVLLNNDAKLHERFFERAARYIDGEPGVDVIGPLVVSEDGFPQPTFHGDSYVRDLLFPSRSLKRFHSVLSFGDDPALKRELLFRHGRRFSFVSTALVGGVSGVCMIIRRATIASLALFDERYFMYVEDKDFCLRARRAGAKIAFFPDICVTHCLERLEAKGTVPWGMVNENLIYFFRKNFPAHTYVVAWSVLRLKALMRLGLRRPSTSA